MQVPPLHNTVKKKKSLSPSDWKESFGPKDAGTLKMKRNEVDPSQFNSQDMTKFNSLSHRAKRKSEVSLFNSNRAESNNSHTKYRLSSDHIKQEPQAFDLMSIKQLKLHFQRQFDFETKNYVPMLAHASLDAAINPVVDSLHASMSDLHKSESLLLRSEITVKRSVEMAKQNNQQVEEAIARISQLNDELRSLKHQPVSLPARIVFYILFIWTWILNVISSVSNAFSKHLRLKFISNRKAE